MYLTNHYFLSFPDDIHGRLRDRKMIPAVFSEKSGQQDFRTAFDTENRGSADRDTFWTVVCIMINIESINMKTDMRNGIHGSGKRGGIQGNGNPGPLRKAILLIALALLMTSVFPPAVCAEVIDDRLSAAGTALTEGTESLSQVMPDVFGMMPASEAGQEPADGFRLLAVTGNVSSPTVPEIAAPDGNYTLFYYWKMSASGTTYRIYATDLTVNASGVYEMTESGPVIFESPANLTPMTVRCDAGDLRLDSIYEKLITTEPEMPGISEDSQTIILSTPVKNNNTWYLLQGPSLFMTDLKVTGPDEGNDSEGNDRNEGNSGEGNDGNKGNTVSAEWMALGFSETEVSLTGSGFVSSVTLFPENRTPLPHSYNTSSTGTQYDPQSLFCSYAFENLPYGTYELTIIAKNDDGESSVLRKEIKIKDPQGPAVTEDMHVVIITGCTYQMPAVEDLLRNGFSQDPDGHIILSHYQTTLTDIGEEPLYSQLRDDMEKADIVYINMINTSVRGPIVTELYNISKEKAAAEGYDYSPVIVVSNVTDTVFIDYLESTIPSEFSPSSYKTELYSYFSNTGYDHGNLEQMIYKMLNDFRGCQFEAAPAHSLPDNAVYHPDSPKIVYETLDEYLAWYGNRTDGHAYDENNGTVGIMFYSSYYPAKVGPTDSLVHELEARGLNVIPVFLYSSTATEMGPKYFSKDGEPIVDSVISCNRFLSGIPFDPEEFDVPVISATVVNMSLEEWKNSSNGYSKNMNRYYRPEALGEIDPVTIGYAETRDGVEGYFSVPEQIRYLADRIDGYLNLRETENRNKRVAVIYYDHEGGKAGISASYLDVAGSIAALADRMREEGYSVSEEAGLSEEELVEAFLTYGYNIGAWAPGQLETAVRSGKVVLIPEETYERWFDEFFLDDPDKDAKKQAVIDQWGKAPGDLMTWKNDSGKYIVIPMVDISAGTADDEDHGRVILAPQPARGQFTDYSTLYHDGSLVPTHQYIAFYAWLQHSEEEGGFGADAVVYMGRHGTQEWLPGKETGLSAYDWPCLMHGGIPVVYYYIVDGLSEGIQAKRRGNAVIVDHLTPAITEADLYGDYADLAALIEQFRTAEDADLKEEYGRMILKRTLDLNLGSSLDMSLVEHLIPLTEDDEITADESPEGAGGDTDLPEDIADDVSFADDENFAVFIDELDDVVYKIRRSAMPYGLHVLGTSPEGDALVSTLRMMLGSSYADDVEKAAAASGVSYREELPSELIRAVIIDGKSAQAAQEDAGLSPDSAVSSDLGKAAQYADGLNESTQETDQLIHALNGGFISPGGSGDPVRNPGVLPTGRNFVTFDPSSMPTEAAQRIGQKLAKEILDGYRENGSYPEAVAYVLWSSETVRHSGVMEACVMYLMGVEYDFSQSSSPTSIRPVDGFEYPTMDVMMQISGLYRDMFPEMIQRLDKAVLAAYEADNPNGNFLKEHINAEKEHLMTEYPDMTEEDALTIASLRIFGPAEGNYGTGMSSTASASNTWDEREDLGAYYIRRMGFAYAGRTVGEGDFLTEIRGTDTETLIRAALSGNGNEQAPVSGKPVNIFEDILSNVELTVHSRSTNTYGVLDNDDFFQYLGGLNLAVSTANGGEYPDSVVLDLKQNGSESVTALQDYLRSELVTRYLNQAWIDGMSEYGYAGAGEMSDFVENLWGWEAMMPDLVTGEMWDSVYDVYVDGNTSGFLKEGNNAYSYQSITGRLIEASRTGNWEPSDEVLSKLVSEYVNSVVDNGVACCHHTCGNPLADEYISGLMSSLNAVDEETAKKYTKIMEETTERQMSDPEKPSGRSSGSSGSGSAVIKGTASVPEMTDKTENEKQITTTDETGQGYGSDVSQNAGAVTGYEMTEKTQDDTSGFMNYLKNPTFSSAGLITIVLVILVVGAIFIGFRKKGFRSGKIRFRNSVMTTRSFACERLCDVTSLSFMCENAV